MVIALIVGLVSGYVVTSRLDATEQQDRQIADFQTQISELEEKVAAKNIQISSLQSEISNLVQQLEFEVLGVYFSPKGGCENQILYWINRANVSIQILIYSFTLDSIGNALVKAHDGGIEVQVVFEKSQVTSYSEYQKLKAAGIMVRNDTNFKSMHNKIMVVDGLVVLTGSFNWSENGEKYNDENIIVINSARVATIYEEEFIKIWNKSQL